MRRTLYVAATQYRAQQALDFESLEDECRAVGMGTALYGERFDRLVLISPMEGPRLGEWMFKEMFQRFSEIPEIEVI